MTVPRSDTVEYDLPSLAPAGVTFKVVGSHTDENGTCSGYVKLEIDGGPFDSPLTPVSLVGTDATGTGLLASGVLGSKRLAPPPAATPTS